MSTDHDPSELPPRDELDALLRIWHDENAERANAGRDAMLRRLRDDRGEASGAPSIEIHRGVLARLGASTRRGSLRAAASLALFITSIALLIPLTSQRVMARQEVILLPDGGKLEARNARGQIIGPCALAHTDVVADIAGPFSRISVTQQYRNPYPYKIEAVYTFPLSHRAAVDRMTMTIRDRSGEERIIEGEVKERQQARQMYESARQAGHVASLLEQERPNIFTQSVANVEPNAEVLIQISYVEMLQQVDGEYRFEFPMVVAPRYIPGRSIESLGNRVGHGRAWRGNLPNELERREGVILLAPASFEQQKITIDGTIEGQNLRFDKQPLGPAPWLQQFIDAAVPIQAPDGAYRQRSDVQAMYQANPSYDFNVLYADGSSEFGQIAGDGLGHVAGRWFYFDPICFRTVEQARSQREGSFASNTDQVADASRITPMPVRPTQRAGHDISVKVNIDTGAGGPAIVNWQSDLHAVECSNGPQYRNDGTKLSLALRNQNEIPNRDFVLRWKCLDDSIQEAVFTHAAPRENDQAGGIAAAGFFTAVIAPPARVMPEHVLPRELIFVLDTSGSMQGAPIERAKSVMSKAIDAMGPGDSFNVITFSGDTRILWKSPRSNSQANRDEAQAFLAMQLGNGGTEMMTAINAALTPTMDGDPKRGPQALTVAQLADLPADGREVTIEVDGREMSVVLQEGIAPGAADLRVRDDLAVHARFERWTIHTGTFDPASERRIQMVGEWRTENGQRIFDKVDAEPLPALDDAAIIKPLRIVMFLTDGQVGNDDAIINAVREHSRTTRVFSFGIGDSPNRYLLDGIAQAGRGEAAYLNLNNDATPTVEAFAKRIEAPVLRDIELAFVGMGDDVEISETIPALDQIPDVWDLKPVIVHGRYRIKGGAGGDAKPQSGKMVLKGKTASGEYLHEINVSLPVTSESHAMLPALWARGRIDQVLAGDEGVRRGGSAQNASAEARQSIIALGEEYHITSAYTSFVAIEKVRVTIAGRSVLVPIPIELPSGMKWEGVFGGDINHRPADDVTRALLDQVPALDHDQAVRLITLDQARRDMAAAPEVALQLHDALASQLSQIVPSDGYVNGRAHFGKAPELNLNAALEQGLLRGQVINGVPPAANKLFSVGGNDLYFAWSEKQLGEFDSSLMTGLGLVALPAVGTRAPGQDGRSDATMRFGVGVTSYRYEPVGEAISINSAGRQLRVDSVTGKLIPLQTGGGGYGGGGDAGGGSGSGGSIFGEAGDDPGRVATPEETRFHLLNIVQGIINPVGWSDLGGDLAEASIDNGVLNFRTLKDTPEAMQTIDRARGLVTMLATVIPEVAQIASIDLPPTKPFDPVADLIAPQDDRVAIAAEDDLPPQMMLYVYDVRDLIEEIVRLDQKSAEDATEWLMDLICEFIAPDIWDVNGGDRGRLQALKGNLIITVESAHHRELERFLTQIREAIAARTPDGKPVEAAVFKGDDAPQPSKPAAAEQSSSIVVYDAHDVLQSRLTQSQPPITKRQAIERLVEEVEQSVDADGWRNAGGERGALRAFADLLIIQNTPENQRSIAELFHRLRQPKPAPVELDAGEEQARRDAAAKATIEALQREDRLRRVIDQRLWLSAFTKDDAAASAARIVVLVNEIDDAAIAQLEALGMRIDDRKPALNLIAGEIADARELVDVALLECVRRIEPIFGDN